MKSISTFVLAAAILLCNVAKANETEPNDTPALANQLMLNGTDSGAINQAGDADWWKVATTTLNSYDFAAPISNEILRLTFNANPEGMYNQLS